MAFAIPMFSPFSNGWVGGLGGPNSGGHTGVTLREHLHMALVEIIGGAPGGRYMGINLYRDFVALRDTANVLTVPFQQNGSPSVVRC